MQFLNLWISSIKSAADNAVTAFEMWSSNCVFFSVYFCKILFNWEKNYNFKVFGKISLRS